MANNLFEKAQAPQPAAQPEAAPQQEPQQQFTLDEAYEIIRKQSAIDHELQKLIDQPGPITRQKVLDAAVRLVAARTVSPQMAAGYLIDLPQDPAMVRNWVERHAADAEDMLHKLLDKVQGVNIPDPHALVADAVGQGGPMGAPGVPNGG